MKNNKAVSAVFFQLDEVPFHVKFMTDMNECWQDTWWIFKIEK